MFGSDFKKLMNEALREIEENGVNIPYANPLDPDCVCVVEDANGVFWEGPNMAADQERYRYMAENSVIVPMDEARAIFNADDVFGRRVYVLTDGKNIIDAETGEITKYEESSLWFNTKKVLNFLYQTEKNARDTLRKEKTLSSYGYYVKEVRVNPDVVDKYGKQGGINK